LNKITVCGGGNGAQTLAPIAAHQLDCQVDLYAPFGDEADRLRSGSDSHGGVETTGAVQAKALLRCISADPAEVIPGSPLVVLVLPAFAHESTLRAILPFLDQGAWVGAIPARGGFDFCAAKLLREHGRPDVALFGLQTLPWACRIQEFGRSIHVLGVKQAVDAASRPAGLIGEMAPVLQGMLGLRVHQAASLLALTLANTGQLIHPGIMYGLFGDWDGTPFPADGVPLFYHGLSDHGANVLAAMSEDVQAIRECLGASIDLSAVRPLIEWLLYSYNRNIQDSSTLRSAFVTNQAYSGLKAPVREVAPGAFVPDFGARYLTEDVPYGLAVSRAIAELAGVETPALDRVIGWAGAQLGKDFLSTHQDETRVPQRYGLDRLDHLITFVRED